MAYTTINKSTDHFNTKLYTGNGSTQYITGVEFSPGLCWIKGRGSSAYDHQLYDVLRGVTKALASNSNDAVSTQTAGLTAFDSDGFTLGSHARVNSNGDNKVAWNWKAGGSGSSNSDGSITSTVSANTTAGFSIVTYTGNGSAGSTVGHGLGATPKFIIVKSDSDNYNWTVYYGDATDYLVLNDTATTTDSNEVWNDTAPTSTVFTVGNRNSTNQNTATFVAYCFAEKQGFSKVGTYTGNGNADGPFVYTGFKPAFVLVKNTTASNNWFLQDNLRAGYNGANYLLKPNTNGAEDTGTHIDILSNGFKTKVNSANCNGSGNIMSYIAFAEAPLVGTNNIPCTAR